MRHILYLVTEDWYFASHRLPLAKAALAEGYRVTVATRLADCAAQIVGAGLETCSINFARSGLNPLKEAGFFRGLVSLYKREKPDLVHHVAMKPVVYGSYAAQLAGVHSVVNALGGLGFLYSSRSTKARLLRPLVMPMLRGAVNGKKSTLILQNKDDRHLFVQQKIAKDDHIRLIPGVGVDADAFPERDKQSGPCLVVLPARLLRSKGVEDFVAAAKRLRGTGLDARFALVGRPDPGNPDSITWDQIDAWRDEGAIEFWGWRTDMAEVLAQAHIVCLPTYYREGVPKTLLEASAARCAIVTTDMPGCRDVVRDGESGLLVPPRNPEALASALAKLIADPQLRERLGCAGRRRAQTDFRSDTAIEATLAIYRELLAA